MMKDKLKELVALFLCISAGIIMIVVVACAFGGCGGSEPDCGCFKPLPAAPALPDMGNDELVLPPEGSESLPFDDGSDATTSDDGTADGSDSGAVSGGSDDLSGDDFGPEDGPGVGSCVSVCVHCGNRGRDCVRICKEQIR